MNIFGDVCLCPLDNAYCYVGTSSAWLIPIWFELQIIWRYLTVNVNDFLNWKGFGNEYSFKNHVN